jgi:protein O-mannosyl-transferase
VQPPRLAEWLLAAMLVAAVFLAYQPAWHGGFLWDDDGHVTRPELQSLHGLHRIWFDLGATQQYYPLLHTAFWIEHKLWGNAPLGYHLVNIALHALAALMVARLLQRLAIPGAFLAAAIFALHPVQVESVAWITELKNALSAVFYLGAALAYLRFDQSRKQSWYWGALGLFVLGLLSKTVTATLPGALLVVFWWQRGRVRWREDVLALVPFFVLGATAGVCTAVVERYLIGAEGEAFEFSIVQRLLLAGRAPWFYLRQLLWPAELMFIYPRWTLSGAVWWQYLFPAATLLALAVLWRLRLRWRGPLAAVLFFLGTLLPVLGFCNVFPFIFSFVADHFQYLASLGIITLASAGGALLLNGRDAWRRRAGYALSVALLAMLATLTWRQSRIYTDMDTLFRATIAGNPECIMVRNNLGILLSDRGQFDAAIVQYQKVLEVDPKDADAHNNLANALIACHQFETAVAHLEQSLKFRPNSFVAEFNLGRALAKLGRLDEAILHFRKVLAIMPDHAEAHFYLGTALAERGQSAAAMEQYRKALAVRPQYAEAHNSLGNALARLSRYDEAIGHYREAIRLSPDFDLAHCNLGTVLADSGQYDEAIDRFQAALKIEPHNTLAREELDRTLAEGEQLRRSLDKQRAAIRASPANAALLNDFAWMLATNPNASIRNGAEAVELAERAAKLSDEREPAILGTLAAAYAETGQFVAAIKTVERAVVLATARGDTALADELRMRIKLYRAGSPYRETRFEHRP